jgi:hypothetical protein
LPSIILAKRAGFFKKNKKERNFKTKFFYLKKARRYRTLFNDKIRKIKLKIVHIFTWVYLKKMKIEHKSF